MSSRAREEWYSTAATSAQRRSWKQGSPQRAGWNTTSSAPSACSPRSAAQTCCPRPLPRASLSPDDLRSMLVAEHGAPASRDVDLLRAVGTELGSVRAAVRRTWTMANDGLDHTPELPR